MAPLSSKIQLSTTAYTQSYNPSQLSWEVWALPLSLATTQGITIVFFSSRYLDVSVPWVRLLRCDRRMTGLQPAGLPHSEIHGSKLVCSSPWLIAAYHVLHRLLEPRHPPCALVRFKNLRNCMLGEI